MEKLVADAYRAYRTSNSKHSQVGMSAHADKVVPILREGVDAGREVADNKGVPASLNDEWGTLIRDVETRGLTDEALMAVQIVLEQVDNAGAGALLGSEADTGGGAGKTRKAKAADGKAPRKRGRKGREAAG